MEDQASPVPAVPAAQSAWIPWVRAAGQLDALTWLALACIVMGWFFLDTLSVAVGPVKHAARFYDMAALIDNPLQLFLGIDRSHLLEVIAFTLLCLATLCTPLAPYLSRARTAWLAYPAPLGLMVVCGAWLYARTSGDFFDTPATAAGLTSDVFRLANDLLHRGSQPVARAVSIGAGSYLALLGSVFLTLRGLRGYREQPPLR
jgi:hypothetical protein